MEIYFTKDAAAELNTKQVNASTIYIMMMIGFECAKIEKKKFYRCRSTPSLDAVRPTGCTTEKRPPNEHQSNTHTLHQH